MDTIYYTANCRTVKVAGGEDQVRVYLVPEARSEGKEHGASERRRSRLPGKPRPTKGEVVSLEMARARAERKQAWKTLVETAWG